MRPLDGMLVIDLTRVLAGPFCTLHLGDMGARVIKIERPGSGDDTRAWGPPFIKGEAAYFLTTNRSKESIALDFKKPAGREILLKLVERADIVVENFRPGTLEKMGLGYPELAARNARLVFCSISGYGHSGLQEWIDRGGYDLVIQGSSGIQWLTGPPDGMPYKTGTSIADLVAGLYGVIGILFALVARGRTGRGQFVDVSMLDGHVSLLSYQAGIHFASGEGHPKRCGNAHPNICPYETFRASDGYVNVSIGTDAMYRRFCQEIERPDLSADARFATNADRVINHDALIELLAPIFTGRRMEEWVALLDRLGIPAGQILSVGEALRHPQLLAREMVVSLNHPKAGEVQVLGTPYKLSETPGGPSAPPPLLGQHTDAVLGELCGLTPAQIEALRADGVV